MNARQKKVWTGVALLAVLLLAVFAALAETKPSNKWRIKFDGKADNEGTIVLRIVPPEGESQDVEVPIPKGKGENAVASLVRDKLKTALGKAYHVERDDWEDVLIKARGNTPDFGVELANSTVTGLKIIFKRE